MSRKQTLWIHPASYTYSEEEPPTLLETLWCERPGWGFLKRRDMWVKKEVNLEELVSAGYHQRKPTTDEGVVICPFCRMHMSSIPGALVGKHKSECGGFGENWQALEEAVITDIRMTTYQKKLADEKRRELEELEDAERRDRQDRIKEGLAARQLSKDRKRRLKQETKEELRNR
jgi:hypothetical protein